LSESVNIPEMSEDDLEKFSSLLQQAKDMALKQKLKWEMSKTFDYKKPFGPTNIGPYEWQVDFHNAGAHYVERCLMAANQVGKTRTGGAETAIHATGFYPDWWKGKQYNRPVEWWVGSETNQSSRDIVQKELIGDSDTPGWIPKNRIIKIQYRQCGIPNVAESILVRHKSGGISKIGFMTYEQGRRKWQGVRMDGLWMDEEPPSDVFSEALIRLISKQGIMYLTFTPLEGVGETVRHFMDGGDGVKVFSATWDDAPHLNKERKEQLINSIPVHERKTRTQGVPMVGTGLVYPINEEEIKCDPFHIPKHYARICGIDFGFDHPFAAVWVAWDRDQDIIYVYDCYDQVGETPAYHVEAIKKRGETIPVSWPHDGQQREKSSGVHLAEQFRVQHRLESMLGFSARYDNEKGGGQDTEPIVMEINERMRTGRLKVFRHLDRFFRELRMYHRKDGQIVKKGDDIMAAMHYAVMMKRFAEALTPPAPMPDSVSDYNPLEMF